MPTFFRDAAAFRRWLEKHHAREDELVVGFHKVDSGRPSLTWSESVDEALCFGWIDGVRKRIDEHTYQIRFTPRRPGSIWSAINIAKVAQLSAEGRMRTAGHEAYARREERKSRVYAYEQQAPHELTDAEHDAFEADTAAWAYYLTVAPSYRKVMTHWVTSAKQPATRERRLAQFVAACAEGRRILR